MIGRPERQDLIQVIEAADARDRSWDAVPRPDCYLSPERVFVSAEPRTVMTILGSCVSICLWNPDIRAGGMNHYLLPFHAGGAGLSGRYGEASFNLLLGKMDALGCKRRGLVAKVFGGARIHHATTGDDSHLGQRNADLAFELLDRERIPVVGFDVGGTLGRKVLFSTSSGHVWIKKIGA